ncbi:tellurium resistance protein TerC [Arthrobacter woluwensis]|uniref:TerC family protein n=1 Tax=Arthrobacter woluwensis TaxID=156980 RepID=UPI000D13412C|nr:TerC family protein [Arthrobacter woluwensis]PSS45067.1 tellurium resistance protein TerC [Arthrobacter woluwensis]
MPELPLWFEVGSFVVLGIVLLVDLLMVLKRPHEPSMKEAGLWVGFYVTLALVFAGLMFAFTGAEYGSQFVAGWVTEYSLSIDNLFVFIIIMARFSVPRKYQQEALMVGIIIALVLRGIFILLGAVIIEQFSWVFYIFGAFLLWTAYNQAKDDSEDDEDGGDNRVVRWFSKILPMHNEFNGGKATVKINGKRLFTPMLLVFLTLGMTDLIFALDSIPAIFGLTKSPFIVFTANIFALMGLRQLYFLLGGLMERLIYLKHALSIILAFIGFKLIFHAMHENELPFINGGQHIEWAPDIPTSFSLIFILGTIVLAVVASLAVSKKREGREATEHQISRTAERVAHQQEVVARREAEAQAGAQAEAAESVEPGKAPEQR